METRTITVEQVHVYFLNLNRMTDRCESCTTVAISTEYNDLMQWYQDQLDPNGPPGRDELGYYHVYKDGSDIYWYNPPGSEMLGDLDPWNHGFGDHWLPIDQYNAYISSMKMCGTVAVIY